MVMKSNEAVIFFIMNCLSSPYNKTVMDFPLSEYGVIFTEFENIDLGSASVNIFKFSKYHTIFTE